jgi:hypothetical protein
MLSFADTTNQNIANKLKKPKGGNRSAWCQHLLCRRSALRLFVANTIHQNK